VTTYHPHYGRGDQMSSIGLMLGLIVATGLIAGIIEFLLKKWFGDQLKRGLLEYDGNPPQGSDLWERVYWRYEQRPHVYGALLESPLSIWCAMTIALIIPFEYWQAYFIAFLALFSTLLILFLFQAWIHAMDVHGRIHAEVEYIHTKEKLEKHKETT
jgi:hypothetical protein